MSPLIYSVGYLEYIPMQMIKANMQLSIGIYQVEKMMRFNRFSSSRSSRFYTRSRREVQHQPTQFFTAKRK